MGKNKKKINESKKFIYVCPNCGNEAPFMRYADKPLKCKYCKTEYYKSEQIRVNRGDR